MAVYPQKTLPILLNHLQWRCNILHMSNALTKIKDSGLSKSIVNYRISRAWSQAHLAKKLGVSRVTIARWENGASQPSTLAMMQLQELIGTEENLIVKAINLTNEKGVSLKTRSSNKKETNILTHSPYVLNGPKDQNIFHSKLIEMQRPRKKADWNIYKKRFSLVQ